MVLSNPQVLQHQHPDDLQVPDQSHLDVPPPPLQLEALHILLDTLPQLVHADLHSTARTQEPCLLLLGDSVLV